MNRKITDSSEGVSVSNEALTEAHVKLSDGRMVTCIKYEGYQAGGLSCDWAGAAQQAEAGR